MGFPPDFYFWTLLHGSVDIKGGIDNETDLLGKWDDVSRVWWDSLSVEDELWKAY